jgi:hypothetical protein
MSYISKQQTSWRNKKKVKKEKMTSVSTSSYPTPAKISSGTTITPEYHTVSACHVGNVSVAQIGKGSLLAGGWSRKASARDVAVIDLTATQYSRNGLGLVQGENNPASIAFKNTIDNAAETPLPWLSLQIQDFNVPYFEDKIWQILAKEVAALTEKGTDVLVACTGGHGRTGLAVSILLGLLIPDIVMPNPIEWLRKNYCTKVVETWEQHKYVHSILGIDEPEDNDYIATATSSYTYGYGAYESNFFDGYGDDYGQTKLWKKTNEIDGISLEDLAELLRDSGYWYEYDPNADARHQLAIKFRHTGVVHYVDNCTHEDEIILFSGEMVGLDDLEWQGKIIGDDDKYSWE